MKRAFDIIAICALLVSSCSDPQLAQCERAADCDDGNDCTADACDPASRTCSNAPAVDGTPCDDGGTPGICTSGVCSQGLCAGVDCNDDNECTEEACDFSDGTCSNEPVLEGTFCDFDGVQGICIAGECVEDRCADDACNDDNPCTHDTCDPLDGSCTNTPVEDYSPCNLEQDVQARSASDGDVDLDGGVDPDGGADPDGGVDPDGGIGPDGGVPTAGYCLDGVCVRNYCFGSPCDDGNSCTNNYCDPEDGRCAHVDRTDGTPCMEDLGMCRDGSCIELPVCGDGRSIPQDATTDEGRLRCQVELVAFSVGVVLKLAARSEQEIQQGDNEIELQVEFTSDAATVDEILGRGIAVLRVHAARATVNATMGDSDPTPSMVEEAPVPCTVSLQPETPARFVTPVVVGLWTLDTGPILELTLQDFEEVLFVFGGTQITLSTLGPSANCTWETELPRVSFVESP